MVQPPPRQRPGSACEECRRRKVRCDRQRPQCQVCYETGIECKISTTRLPRGPRKGQLRTLRTRIAALERCLAAQHPEISHQMTALLDGPVLDCEIDDLRRDSTSDDRTNSNPTSPQSSASPELVSELMRADLDQLYFDRVHPFTPILQRWRYHIWTKQPRKTPVQTCLQYAMWTLAASLSAQFRALRDPLYHETRRMLDALDQSPTAAIEQAQAWVLLCIYEYMQLSPLQAWMTAGRCSRLVLGMRLYELDDPNHNHPMLARDMETSLVDWTGLEERRRTFWMAYSLDRFISFHNGLPFTLNEQLITTRLPTPEEQFQSGHPVLTPYLSDILSPSLPETNMSTNPFTEYILLATLAGRALTHRQKVSVEQITSSPNTLVLHETFWTRHTHLHTLLTQRIHSQSQSQSSTQIDLDLNLNPLLMFARIVAQTLILFLQGVLESIAWKTGDHLLGILEYERVCVVAAREVVGLVEVLGQGGVYKVHPLTPIPLMMCTEFFAAHSYLDTGFEGMLQAVLGWLQGLERVKSAVQSQSPGVSG